MGWPMGPGPGFVHTPADVTPVAKAGIQLKLDNIKCPCKMAISKIGSGESRNGEWGTGNGESLK